MAGVPIFTLSQWLGHSNVQTTMRYAHLAPDHNKVELAKVETYLKPEDGTKMAQMAVAGS
jgi:integrase